MSVSLTNHDWLDDRTIRPGHEYRRLGETLAFLCICWSIGLLGIGYWIPGNKASNRPEVGQLIQFFAASIATMPVLVRLMRGWWENSAEAFTDQLVVLAIFGALATGEYATAVLIPVIMDLGHFIEQRSIQGTQAAIDGLQRLNARAATILDESGERIVLPEDLEVGQVLLVRPGEVIAADGIVSGGRGAIDESTITGESFPREVTPHDAVHAGTVTVDGLLQVTITGTGAHTALGRIRSMLGQAIQSKGPVTRILERYAELYVPVVMLIAAFVLFITNDLQRVIAVFIVSCPCALILSAPAAMIAALASATRQGILIKNSKFLESLADAETVVFDKTGTLTEGQHEVVRIVPQQGVSEVEVMQVALCCASTSSHPVSRTITRFCQSRGMVHPDVPPTHMRDMAGRGVEVMNGNNVLRLGRMSWLQECGVSGVSLPEHSGPLVGVGNDSSCLGVLLLQDRLRLETPHVIEELRRLGIRRLVLLTGDRAAVATDMADRLGFDHVISEALPQTKLEVVRAECAEGRKVIVIGDGINDALALAAGSIGIALGARGADIAIQSADIALMANDLGRVVTAIRLSRCTRQIIQQNVLLAAVTAGVMLALGSFGLLPPLIGAILHNAGTVLVLINSARVLRANG